MMLSVILKFYSVCPFSAPFSIIRNCIPIKNLLFMPFLRKLYLNSHFAYSQYGQMYTIIHINSQALLRFDFIRRFLSVELKFFEIYAVRVLINLGCD